MHKVAVWCRWTCVSRVHRWDEWTWPQNACRFWFNTPVPLLKEKKKSCQEQSVKTSPEIGIGAAVAGHRQNLIQIGCILSLESTDVLKIKSVRLQQSSTFRQWSQRWMDEDERTLHPMSQTFSHWFHHIFSKKREMCKLKKEIQKCFYPLPPPLPDSH